MKFKRYEPTPTAQFSTLVKILAGYLCILILKKHVGVYGIHAYNICVCVTSNLHPCE